MSATGEHRIEVGEQTRVGLPLVWIWPLLVVVAGFGAGGWAIKAQANEQERIASKLAAHSELLTEYVTTTKHMAATLERLEKKVDRVEWRVIRANGREE